MPAGWDMLSVTRLTAIIQALQDVRELPGELAFLGRTSVVPATDAEIIGRWVGRVIIADIISDDAQAAVYSSGKTTFERNAIPNLKTGRLLTQEELNLLQNLQGANIPDRAGAIDGWFNRMSDWNLLSIRQRMEMLIIAMHIDALNYNKLGIQLSGVSWGMPADLKVTPSTPWTTAGSATPVDDILTVKTTSRIRYGQVFDRITMSTQAFRYMIATTEFQAKARMLLAPNVSFVNLSLQDLNFQQQLAQNVLQVRELELYDSRYWEQLPDGSQRSQPFLPINKVVLTSMNDDNNPSSYDFANAVVTESIVGALAGTSVVGQFGGQQYGPVGYATVPPDLNPPNLTLWGVARGFPRKFRLQSSAVLTVGTFVDSVAVGEPF